MKKISFPADIEQETDEMIRSGMREQAEIPDEVLHASRNLSCNPADLRGETDFSFFAVLVAISHLFLSLSDALFERANALSSS